MTKQCDHHGGRGIGAGHICKCSMNKGHDLWHGKYHCCPCGAIWEEK